MNSTPISQPPMAEPMREVLHGVEVEDPFRWLEDQDSPATRSFIQAEQQVYREYLGRHNELRERIERRVTELLTVEAVDLPVSDHRGGLLYLKREADHEQKAIYYQDESKSERQLISVAMLGRDSFASLAIIHVSSGGRYLAFGIRTGGEDVQEVGIYDLIERRLLPDRLPRGFCRGLVFDRIERGFYYVHEETTGPYQLRRAVRRHEFGDDQQSDREIFHAGEGPAMRLIVRESEDFFALGYLILALESVPRTCFLIHEFPLNKLPRELFHISDGSLGLRFCARQIEASTTYAAPLGRMVRISLEHPEPWAWSDLIPETAECLCSWEAWGRCLVIHYTAGCTQLTRIYSASNKPIRTIEYPREGTSKIGRVDPCAHRLFYSYSDITMPTSIYFIDLTTGEHHLWWQPPTSISQKTPEVEHHDYSSKDGTKIPITLVHPRGTQGVRPILLSAYGGGGVSITPKFSVLLTILLEAGFTCATAHVRGGGEGGIDWHIAAQKQRKQTTVDDLICAAKWLIENGYTTHAQLGVAGQSNGALLTLCMLTQRPDLFRAALALGPLADLTRFHIFGVARGSVAELGSPDDPDEFAALYRLSPYHRVQPEAHYPAVLIISGDRDKRCDSLHARKMIARLHESLQSNHPVLLDYTEHRGHKPVLPLTERIRSLSDRLTFLIAELNAPPSRELAL
jgi:prolyl oligopeptidase